MKSDDKIIVVMCSLLISLSIFSLTFAISHIDIPVSNKTMKQDIDSKKCADAINVEQRKKELLNQCADGWTGKTDANCYEKLMKIEGYTK